MPKVHAFIITLCCVVLVWIVPPANAMERLEGRLIAQKSCAAYQSKNKRTNPGDVSLVPNKEYEMLGTNPPGRDWYQVVVPDAPGSKARWVEKSCGKHVRALTDIGTPATPTEIRGSTEATDLLLALTWQPAFCERRRRSPACKKINKGALPVASTNFSLHGLWPQPRSAVYCGVSQKMQRQDKEGQWQLLPAPELDADTAARLAIAMPGSASFLDRHEWIKHGTCFFADGQADEYYDDSLFLLDAINGSAVGSTMSNHIGAYIHAKEIRAAFDRSFGPGAGTRVEVICTEDQDRVLIQEIRINLKGEVTAAPDVGALIRAAPTRRMNCSGGHVDPAGLQ